MRTCDTNLWPYFETLGASYLQTVLSDPHNSSLYSEGVAGHLHAKYGHTTLLSSNAFSKPVHQKSMRGWSWELHRGRIARQRSTCWSSAEDPFLSRDPWPRRSWCCSSACQQLYYNIFNISCTESFAEEPAQQSRYCSAAALALRKQQRALCLHMANHRIHCGSCVISNE